MAPDPDYVPLKFARLLALFFSFAWGIVGLAAGINALVKSNKEEQELERQLPAGTTVNINTDDVSQTGTIIAVVSIVIAVLSLVYILLLLMPLRWGQSRQRLSTSTLAFQWGSLAFLALWLFTVEIPFDVFFNTRSAQVRAFIGMLELSPQVIRGAERLLGIDPTYKSKFYLKLLAILPWFTFLFSVVAAVVTFVAYSRAKRHSGTRIGEKNHNNEATNA